MPGSAKYMSVFEKLKSEILEGKYRSARGFPSSPAIDAGDPSREYGLEPEPNGKRLNLGAYGNTPWATTTPPPGMVLLLK